MFWLRVLMCFSALIGIVYYSLLDQFPPTVGQISLLLVNVVQIFLLILEKKPVLLEPEVRQPCLANVQAIGEATWLSWSSAHLENLKRGQQDLYIKMQSVLGMDVIRKLQNQTESNRTVAVTPDI